MSQERRQAVADRLGTYDASWAIANLDPAVATYYKRHGPCERPESLAFLCVRVGLAGQSPILPNLDLSEPPLRLQQALETKRGNNPAATIESVILEMETAAAEFWVASARELDRWLGIRGCGPHTWSPTQSGQHLLAPVAAEPPVKERETEKTTGESKGQESVASPYGIDVVSPDGTGGSA
ncbi:MAG: hypothetical protein AABY18_01245 [Candidatus Thermoplasmatota archaeon]